MGARHAAAIVSTLALMLPAGAAAFDTGPHSDITRDAMSAEGFGRTAADIGVVNNWFVDLYSNASAVPHSGHADTINEILAFSYGDREHWPKAVIDGAVYSHFDSTFANFMFANGLEAEWDRMSQRTAALARQAAANKNPRALLSLIGLSLHEVQDFYSHTNWIDALGYEGADGPNWPVMSYGRTPTWFDVPRDVRDGFGMGVYAGGTPGHDRKHAAWNTDDNKTVVHAVAKDWPGRPGYDDAHIAAYFATRQWLQAIKTWVNDPGIWRQAQVWSNRAGNQLDHDLWGSTWIGMHSGHWQGQGEPCNPTWSLRLCGDREGPGGNLIELRSANKHYFEDWSKSTFRKQFQQQIVEYSKFNTGDPIPAPITSSQAMQRTTEFVRLRVLKTRALGLGDVGPDEADMYSRATIAGQRFQSGTIIGEDSYNFPKPNAPYEWLKAIPAGTSVPEPVTAIQVEVKTSSARYSGTDDSVSLRLGPTMRFQLDKRLYDDFERGDSDTYSVPIDALVRNGLRIADINQVQLEKAPDGLGGGWKLKSVKLTVNGRVLYNRGRIEQWLEGKHRFWAAPDFRSSAPSGPALGVTLDIFDDDYSIYGDDDHGDLDPFGMRKTFARTYTPGAPDSRWTTGSSTYAGRLGDGDSAKVLYALETLTPTAAPFRLPEVNNPPIEVVAPPATTPTPPPPVLKPDLVITAMGNNTGNGTYYVTVQNQGNAPSPSFSVRVTNPSDSTYSKTVTANAALPAGASVTLTYETQCISGTYTGNADPTNAISESNESNNTRTYEQPQPCIL